MDKFFKITGTILCILFFTLFILIINHLRINYPKRFKTKSFIAIVFSWSTGNIFWKEVFKSSYKSDVSYTLYLMAFRIVILLFIIIGFIWSFTS
jgi:hypothetical protein